MAGDVASPGMALSGVAQFNPLSKLANWSANQRANRTQCKALQAGPCRRVATIARQHRMQEIVSD
jgi:hypothetical protein